MLRFIVAESDITQRDELVTAILRYEASVHDESASEEEVDRALLAVDVLAPHSYITDLLYGAERERSQSEAIEEALFREHIWHEGGESALYTHMESQLAAALQESLITARQRHYCEKMIEHIRQEMRRT
jgi:hypothetical protein